MSNHKLFNTEDKLSRRRVLVEYLLRCESNHYYRIVSMNHLITKPTKVNKSCMLNSQVLIVRQSLAKKTSCAITETSKKAFRTRTAPVEQRMIPPRHHPLYDKIGKFGTATPTKNFRN